MFSPPPGIAVGKVIIGLFEGVAVDRPLIWLKYMENSVDEGVAGISLTPDGSHFAMMLYKVNTA